MTRGLASIQIISDSTPSPDFRVCICAHSVPSVLNLSPPAHPASPRTRWPFLSNWPHYKTLVYLSFITHGNLQTQVYILYSQWMNRIHSYPTYMPIHVQTYTQAHTRTELHTHIQPDMHFSIVCPQIIFLFQ